MNSADRYAEHCQGSPGPTGWPAAEDLGSLHEDRDEPGPLVAGYLWAYALALVALPFATLAAAPFIAQWVMR